LENRAREKSSNSKSPQAMSSQTANYFFNGDTFILFTWLIWSVGFKTGIVLIHFLSRVILTESDSELGISASRYILSISRNSRTARQILDGR
jgi:hypothetical protein